MTKEAKDFRLDGIYSQRQEGFFMQRVKLPAGVISSQQARVVAHAAERFGRGSLHLTTRGSIEIHWLAEQDLLPLKSMLASSGLTSRGACGGAVRGISCGSSQDSAQFPLIESISRRLHRHFTGNPRFERLPKKFKIGIESSVDGRRHLIQDVGLVLSTHSEQPGFDLYVAGGLGREPQAGFLLEAGVSEDRVIPKIESILRVYAAGTPAGRRLKHLLKDIGEDEFRRRVAADPASTEELPPYRGLAETFFCNGTVPLRVTAYVFAGSITSAELTALATIADLWSNGVLLVTSNQDISFPLAEETDRCKMQTELEQLGFQPLPEHQVACRTCPGSHECRAGLSPTRDIARSLTVAMGPVARRMTWAVSGCHNSCTQPQLADYGIVTSRLLRGDNGQRTPLFDLYRARPESLGEKIATELRLDELSTLIQGLG